MVPERLAGAVLEIDLDALVANWQALGERAKPAECAAVVKADAYGIGAAAAAPALAAAGCRSFFVAFPAEAVALRSVVPETDIYILSGVPRGAEAELDDLGLIPVLASLDDIAAWTAEAGDSRPAALLINTGMTRLGLGAADIDILGRDDRLDGIELRLVISHLACAEEGDNPMNRAQLDRFNELRAKLPPAPASFANSSGIFLGPDYLFDLVRAGVALYGVNPTPGRPNPMREVVRLTSRILQVHEVAPPMSVGYGATHKVAGPSRIAVVPVGYADGYLRSLSGRGFCYVDGRRVPVVGRVSMDLITLDVSDLAPERSGPGAPVELIGGPVPIDDLAAAADTIAYELLTSLGPRYHRVYRGGA